MSVSNYSPTFPSVLKSEIIYSKTNLFQTLQQIAKNKLLKKVLKKCKKEKKEAILASLYGRNQKAGFHIHFSTFRTYIVFLF